MQCWRQIFKGNSDSRTHLVIGLAIASCTLLSTLQEQTQVRHHLGRLALRAFRFALHRRPRSPGQPEVRTGVKKETGISGSRFSDHNLWPFSFVLPHLDTQVLHCPSAQTGPFLCFSPTSPIPKPQLVLYQILQNAVCPHGQSFPLHRPSFPSSALPTLISPNVKSTGLFSASGPLKHLIWQQ